MNPYDPFVVQQRTITQVITAKTITRPAFSVKGGCALLVLFLILGTGTLIVLWVATIVGFTAISNQIPMDKIFSHDNQQLVYWFFIVWMGLALGGPIAAFFEASDFLMWLKER